MNISSGNGLALSGNRPFRELMSNRLMFELRNITSTVWRIFQFSNKYILETANFLVSRSTRERLDNNLFCHQRLQSCHHDDFRFSVFSAINSILKPLCFLLGWVGLWGFLWWAPSAKRKDHHGVSSGWSSVWHCSNTGLSSSQYEQISIILGVWPFCLTPFFFRSITFWRAYG